MLDYIYVWKKNPETREFDRCLVNQIKEPHTRYMAIVGSNMDHDTRSSMISIESLKFNNYDPEAYQNDEELRKEKSELRLENAQVEQVDQGKYHPADMLMMDVKSHMEE